MKLFGSDMQTGQIGNFSFSGARPEKLGAAQYTLATIACDKTPSVSDFVQELLNVKRTVVTACRKDPHSENLMLRSTEFNEHVEEIHGFAELNMIDENDYVAPRCTGRTGLYDAAYSAIAATNEYGRILSDNDFGANGIVFLITDGDDNASTHTPRSVAEEIKRGVKNEWLESLIVVLIGVNATRYRRELEQFKNDAGITEYIDVADVTPQSLAKLAKFITSMTSSQSQSLGTGGPSQMLSF